MKSLKNKMRLDEYLVEQEYFENIEVAKRNIMAGNVIVNENKIEKAGETIHLDKIKSIRIKTKDLIYVSRGGLKLEKAIKYFNINFEDKIILDVGASTGGFTDCSLKNGARFVYALDVGTNQLDWSLRVNNKVKSIENKHINDLTLEDIDNKIPDIIVMDISFISIKKVLPTLKEFMNESTKGIFLIKPQFEADRKDINKGIVENIEVHKNILKNIKEFCENINLYLCDVTSSPIKGTKGNIEYLSYFSLKEEEVNYKDIDKLLNDTILKSL